MRFLPKSNLIRVLLLLASMVLVAHISFFVLVDHYFVRIVATNRGEHTGKELLTIERALRESEEASRASLREALLEELNYGYSDEAPAHLLRLGVRRPGRPESVKRDARGFRGHWGPAPHPRQKRELQRLFEQGLRNALGPEARLYMRSGSRADTRGGPWFWIETGLDELPWVGIPTRHLHADAPQVLIYWLLVIGAIVFVSAAAFARLSNRPLELLVEAVEKFGRRQDPPDIPEVGTREIRSLTRAFKNMAGDIVQANQDREMMLAGISHDLRSPMARMAVALEMASGLPEDLKQSMEEDLRDMDSIVEQFLAYVRSDEGEELISVDLAELVREVVERTRRACEGSDVIIEFEIGAPSRIQGGPTTLKRLLQNLLDNALRHGGKSILVRGEMEEGAWLLVVEDDGPGVPEERIDEVFAPFARGDRARTSAGSGLGLAIVRRIVEGRGGSIRALNRSAGGLRVEVRMPV